MSDRTDPMDAVPGWEDEVRFSISDTEPGRCRAQMYFGVKLKGGDLVHVAKYTMVVDLHDGMRVPDENAKENMRAHIRHKLSAMVEQGFLPVPVYKEAASGYAARKYDADAGPAAYLQVPVEKLILLPHDRIGHHDKHGPWTVDGKTCYKLQVSVGEMVQGKRP